jgi:hypothetical protein
MMNTIVTLSCIILVTMILLFSSPLSLLHSPSSIKLNTAEGQFPACPVGYQVNVNGICVPATTSQLINPVNQLAGQPQVTFAQLQSSELTSSLISPTLINPPAGQLSPWFPSLPAIVCGGSSTITTIGSLEGDSSDSSNGDNGKNGNKNDKDGGSCYSYDE